MQASLSFAVLRSPVLWAGMLLLAALIAALGFSDGVTGLARFSANYQRSIQRSLSVPLQLLGTVGLFGALREVRNLEILSYSLILVIGFWRLWTGLTGRLHEHDHGREQGDDHDGHGNDRHDHVPRRTMANWLLLTAAGIAPGAGALVMILLSVAMGVVWAGFLGVLAIAVGMALTRGGIGVASMVAQRLILADGRSRETGRLASIAASLIVIATAGILLLSAPQNLIR